MPNEIRPCTLWGVTFDAMKVHSVTVTLELMRKEEIVLVRVRDEEEGFIYIKHPTSPNHKEADLLQEAITTIAKALNAPVLATDEVMKDLPEDVRAVVIDEIGVPYSLDRVSRAVTYDGWAWGDDYHVMSYNRIQAFNDPKTAEYLRQFTLDGVRIKEGG